MLYVIPAGVFTLVRGAVTTEYNGGSYSLIPKTYLGASTKNDCFKKDGTVATNPLKRPTMHEIFGHGRLLALKIADQHTPVIQFENLVLRVMKKDIYRDGTNHDGKDGPGGKVDKKDDIPEYLNKKDQ